ncbi:hypothetical protein DYB25_003088 [Aphanomyces astaci]|uniref:Cwf19-like C-terminal domain-containing protein n=1 Tax=Aphanomyces astaci TaxID=112090 RepID=A0A396ZSW0_APHAT|nr:hypothetical protein DYB25_003088 [Aphanomyces astaci]
MVKVLLSGDVGGNWDALHARVEKLHTSAHGPFDVVLCAGFSDVSANAIRAWPLPVYVLGGLGDQPKNTSTNLHVVSENSVHTISGLHVAFLADPEAVQSFRSALTAQPVDLLITTDYPQGYKLHNLPKSQCTLRDGSIGNEAYLAIPKGPIVPDHALIVPIQHTASMTTISAAARAEVNQFKAALTAYVYMEAFHNEGTKYKVDFTPLPDGAEIEASEYLLVECPSPPTRLLHTVHGKHYMQFGRDAVAALLNMPRRGNWKRTTSLSSILVSVFAVCLLCQAVLFRNIFSAVADLQHDDDHRAHLRSVAAAATWSDLVEAGIDNSTSHSTRASSQNTTEPTGPSGSASKSIDALLPFNSNASVSLASVVEPTTTSNYAPLSSAAASPSSSLHPWTVADVSFDRVMDADTRGVFVSKFASAPRGIVMCMHTRMVPMGVSLIQELRALGNIDPVQVFYCLPNELSSTDVTLLTGLGNVEVVDLCSVLVTSRVFADHGVASRFQNFWLKPLALVFSPFPNVLLVDVDTIFLHDPALLWTSSPVVDTGTLFFHDRVLDFSQFLNQDVGPDDGQTFIQVFFDTFPYAAVNLTRPAAISDTMRRSMVWNKHTAHEQDSSVVLIDKTRAGPHVLETLWYLVTVKRFQDQITFSWGDKEAFWLAFELAGIPYAFSPWNCGVVSLPDDAALHPTTLCGSLAQYWPDLNKNDVFFVNGNAVVNVYRLGDGRHTDWAARAASLVAAIPKLVTPRHTRHPTSQNRQGLDQTCLLGEGATDIPPAFQDIAERRIRRGQAIEDRAAKNDSMWVNTVHDLGQLHTLKLVRQRC